MSQAGRRELAVFMRLLNTRYEPRLPMPADLRRRLQAEFAPDIECLGALLGRDLSEWSRD